MSDPMFSSSRVDCDSYLEHIYLHEDGRQLLVATVYESTRRGIFKFSCEYKLFSEDYRTVADAKHDLFQILEFNLKKPVDLPVRLSTVNRSLSKTSHGKVHR